MPAAVQSTRGCVYVGRVAGGYLAPGCGSHLLLHSTPGLAPQSLCLWAAFRRTNARRVPSATATGPPSFSPASAARTVPRRCGRRGWADTGGRGTAAAGQPSGVSQPLRVTDTACVWQLAVSEVTLISHATCERHTTSSAQTARALQASTKRLSFHQPEPTVRCGPY